MSSKARICKAVVCVSTGTKVSRESKLVVARQLDVEAIDTMTIDVIDSGVPLALLLAEDEPLLALLLALLIALPESEAEAHLLEAVPIWPLAKRSAKSSTTKLAIPCDWRD